MGISCPHLSWIEPQDLLQHCIFNGLHTVDDPGFLHAFLAEITLFWRLASRFFSLHASVERYDVVLHLSAGIPVPVVVVSLAVRSDEYGVRNSNGSLV